MASEDRIAHQGKATMGSLKKLFGRERDQHYESWVVSIQPEAAEPAGKDVKDTVGH
jgi:hypothetical protein